MRIRYAFWVPVLLGLGADLLSKHLIFRFLSATPGEGYPLLEPWVVLQLQRNPGGVFGMLPGMGYIFIVLSFAALGAVAWMLRSARPEQRVFQVALGLVVAGAVGNLIDRLWLGYVRDFIYIQVIGWPAFNVADMCICVAAGLLVVEIVRQELKRKKGEGSERKT